MKDLGSGLRLARSSDAVTEGSIFVSSVSWSISSVVFCSVAVVGIGFSGWLPLPGSFKALSNCRSCGSLFITISNNVLGGIAPVTRKQLSSVFKINFDSLSHYSAG